MQRYRDIIIGLTSKGLFVLPSHNEKTMIFPGMDGIVGANSRISISLMSLGGKLHWASIEIGFVFQPGTCFFPQLTLSSHLYHCIFSLIASLHCHLCPVITCTLQGTRCSQCRAANGTHVNSTAIRCHCLDRNKFICYSCGCHMYFRRCSIII